MKHVLTTLFLVCIGCFVSAQNNQVTLATAVTEVVNYIDAEVNLNTNQETAIYDLTMETFAGVETMPRAERRKAISAKLKDYFASVENQLTTVQINGLKVSKRRVAGAFALIEGNRIN